MRSFRSLLLKKIDIRLPGLSVLRLRLHRHLAQVDKVSAHSHSHGQLLCYLTNGGTLRLNRKSHEIVAGTLVWIPAGRIHSFQEHPFRRPICLAIDLRMQPPPPARIATLGHSEAEKIRRQISALGKLNDPSSIEARFLSASHALAILDIEFRALGFLPREAAPVPAIIGKFKSLASDPAYFHTEVQVLCKPLGHDPDYLNRLHKAHTGLTLRQQRDACLLDACKRALREGGSVSAAAARCGFVDMNYFSRWFRRHVGLSPSEFAGSAGTKLRKK